MNTFCDLHAHSNCSDGADAPEALISIAKAAGLGAVALTDHNSIAGLSRFESSAKASGVIAVPGIEVTAGYLGKEVHILGLFVSPAARAPLTAYLEEMNKRKRQANRDLIGRLCAAGYHIDEAAVFDTAGDALPNRVHVAKELVKGGYVASIPAAFATLLAEGGDFYRPAKRLDAMEVIETLRSLCILPLLAHPMISLTPDELSEFLSAAKEKGLVGMETLYPMYTSEQTALAAALAKRFDLLPSGGSDYHGANRPGVSLGHGEGDLAVPMSFYQSLATQHQTLFGGHCHDAQ